MSTKKKERKVKKKRTKLKGASCPLFFEDAPYKSERNVETLLQIDSVKLANRLFVINSGRENFGHPFHLYLVPYKKRKRTGFCFHH